MFVKTKIGDVLSGHLDHLEHLLHLSSVNQHLSGSTTLCFDRG
jgi:hypothetical protein